MDKIIKENTIEDLVIDFTSQIEWEHYVENSRYAEKWLLQEIKKLINSIKEEQWISVEDERRSTDWFNVVCRNNKNVTKARYFKGEWYKNHRIITDVTHWQLLPQPPKE